MGCRTCAPRPRFRHRRRSGRGVRPRPRAPCWPSARCTMRPRYPRPGWAEQSPADWWDALGEATRGADGRSRRARTIDGICVATTASTVVVCKRDGTPLRPALLWMDCRAAAEADRTARSRHPGAWPIPAAATRPNGWCRRPCGSRANEPQIYAGAEIICECLDYVNFMLTGRWVGSRMNATCKWNYDFVAGRFHDDLLPSSACRISPTQAAAPRSSPSARRSRRISAAAAAHLGLVEPARCSRRAASTRISAWSAPTRWRRASS